jgi:hypothetical protein
VEYISVSSKYVEKKKIKGTQRNRQGIQASLYKKFSIKIKELGRGKKTVRMA